MALNWAMLEGGKPVPLPGERFVNVMPNADVSVLANGDLPQLRKTGIIYVSAQRLVFVDPLSQTTSPTSAQNDLVSLSIPLIHILQSEFKQPYFSANYLSLQVHPVAGGGLPSVTTVEIRFHDQGLFVFVEMVDKLRARAIAQRREARDANILPSYVAPETPQSQISEAVPPPLQAAQQPESELPPAYTI